MSSKLPTKQDGKSKAKSLSKQNEELDIEAFCKDVNFDDISFEDWQDVVETLDLYIDLNISTIEARAGVIKELGFTRTIDKQRSSIRLLVDVPPGAKGGTKVTLKGEGDRSGKERGDLYVIIRLPPDRC